MPKLAQIQTPKKQAHTHQRILHKHHQTYHLYPITSVTYIKHILWQIKAYIILYYIACTLQFDRYNKIQLQANVLWQLLKMFFLCSIGNIWGYLFKKYKAIAQRAQMYDCRPQKRDFQTGIKNILQE